MKDVWFKHNDIILAVEDVEIIISTKKRNIKKGTNDTDKYSFAEGANITLGNGDIIMADNVTIKDFPLGRLIETKEEVFFI